MRPRVTPPQGMEERLSRVELDVAALRVDMQWVVEAIIAMHSGTPLPPRAGTALPPHHHRRFLFYFDFVVLHLKRCKYLSFCCFRCKILEIFILCLQFILFV
ncbi:hypothetical protein Hanom_Chr07g00634751 [Helianthus anomalus]